MRCFCSIIAANYAGIIRFNHRKVKDLSKIQIFTIWYLVDSMQIVDMFLKSCVYIRNYFAHLGNVIELWICV